METNAPEAEEGRFGWLDKMGPIAWAPSCVLELGLVGSVDREVGLGIPLVGREDGKEPVGSLVG